MEHTRKVMRVTALLLLGVLCQHLVSAQSSQEQAVLDLSKKKFEWLIHGRADSLREVLDERMMFIHSSGWSQSKQEVMEDMTSGSLVYKKVDIKEAGVRLYDKTAVVVGSGRFSGEREGNPFDIDLRYTEVYVLKDKKWHLVSRHANRLP
jgi:hypothetical protein